MPDNMHRRALSAGVNSRSTTSQPLSSSLSSPIASIVEPTRTPIPARNRSQVITIPTPSHRPSTQTPRRSKPHLRVNTSLPVPPLPGLTVPQTQPQWYEPVPIRHPALLATARSAPLFPTPKRLVQSEYGCRLMPPVKGNKNPEAHHGAAAGLLRWPHSGDLQPSRPRTANLEKRCKSRRMSERARDLLRLDRFRRAPNSSVKGSRRMGQASDAELELYLASLSDPIGVDENALRRGFLLDDVNDDSSSLDYGRPLNAYPVRPYRSPGTASFLVTNHRAGAGEKELESVSSEYYLDVSEGKEEENQQCYAGSHCQLHGCQSMGHTERGTLDDECGDRDHKDPSDAPTDFAPQTATYVELLPVTLQPVQPGLGLLDLSRRRRRTARSADAVTEQAERRVEAAMGEDVIMWDQAKVLTVRDSMVSIDGKTESVNHNNGGLLRHKVLELNMVSDLVQRGEGIDEDHQGGHQLGLRPGTVVRRDSVKETSWGCLKARSMPDV